VKSVQEINEMVNKCRTLTNIWSIWSPCRIEWCFKATILG